jgi:peptidyl-prolyl cis-trans isomerase D
MLQKIREKSSGWVATVILGLLIIPFAFFGIDSYVTQQGETYVARIAQPPSWWSSAPRVWPFSYFWTVQDIDSQTYRNRLELVRAQMREQQGEAFDPKAFESVENKRKIIDAMIDEHLLRLVADREGIVISDTEVRDVITMLPDFQVDGAFNADRYQLLLASQAPPITPRDFEAQIRERLKNALIADRITRSEFVTDAEVDRLMRLFGEHRDVSYVTLPPVAADTQEVTAAQIDAWYKAHQGEYRKPESIRLEYVEVDGSHLDVQAVDEQALIKRYEEQMSKYASAEKRDIAHILIEVPATASDADKKAAEAKAKMVAEKAASGADFAQLAREYSDDSGSKNSGGSLGVLSKGGMPGAFDDAAFALKEGAVSPAVQTDFGWHIIKVNQIQNSVIRPFDEVRDELAHELSEGARERAFNELTGKLVDAVYKTPNSLEPAAKLLDLNVQSTPRFTRMGGPGIASNDKVLRAAFSEVLLQDGTASDPIELGPEHTVLIRVIDHEPERALALDDVRDAVVAAIHADREHKAAEAAADALLKVAEEKGLDAAAQNAGLQLAQSTDIVRQDMLPSAQAVQAFFSQPRSQDGKAKVAKAFVNGQYIVFAVHNVRDADLAQVTPQERAMLRQQLSMASGMSAQEAFIRAARLKQKIEVAEDRL